METRSEATSVATGAREMMLGAPGGTFFRRADFVGSDRAVESALSRLAATGELVRVRRGLYWLGTQTRFGMTQPSSLDVALAIAGPGAGPAGVSAARMVGLTTQVPGTVEVAVPGKAPSPMHGVRFRSRPFARRERRLTPLEVAVLEVLRDPSSSEVAWSEAERRVTGLLVDHLVRRDVLDAEVADEHHRAMRQRWRMMQAA